MQLACLLFILVPGIAISGDEDFAGPSSERMQQLPLGNRSPQLGPTPNWCPDRSSTIH